MKCPICQRRTVLWFYFRKRGEPCKHCGTRLLPVNHITCVFTFFGIHGLIVTPLIIVFLEPTWQNRIVLNSLLMVPIAIWVTEWLMKYRPADAGDESPLPADSTDSEREN